jgi:hypothetical protein
MKNFIIVVKETVTMEYLVKAKNEKEARNKFDNGEAVDGYDIDCQIDEILSIKEYKEDQSYKSQGDGHIGE